MSGENDRGGKAARSEKTVAILLSTYNGERYLPEQLASFEAQSYPHWRLLWRDDGSEDGTRALLRAFADRVGEARCREVTGQDGRLGVQASFLWLLQGAQDYPFVAFADQDDVWLPEKLARAVRYMEGKEGDAPSLYCGRQLLVDETLRPLRLSPSFRADLPFPAPLAQNIATGCTMLLNRAACRAIAPTRPPEGSVHDWWCYIVVTALGGRVFFDDTPSILYRQHAHNVIGAANTRLRVWRALHKEPASVLRIIDAHARAVEDSVVGVPSDTLAKLARLRQALRGSFGKRIMFVLGGNLRRQRWSEGVLLAFWVLAGGHLNGNGLPT